MRIAVDARIIYTSTGRYIERLLDHLQTIDQDNEYLVLLTAADFDRWEPKAANFTKVQADFRPFTLAEQLQYGLFLYRLNCDLVHFTQVHFPLLYLKRRVTTIHDFTLIDYVNKRRESSWLKSMYKHYVKPAAFRLAMWWAVHFSAAIITPTEFVKQEVVKRYHINPHKVNVTLEDADPLTDHPVRPSFIGEHDSYVMYLGNAFPYKNVWLLIEAFGQLNQPGLKLVLCGKKEFFYEELSRQTKSAGIQGVIFAGFTPDNEAAWLYEHATVFVHPSLSEGFCLPLLEAMNYGAPLLVSNASCIPEVSGEAADYFDPHDVDDLTAKLTHLLADHVRRSQLVKLGHQRATQFSWERMARQTLAVYQQSSPKRSQA